MENKILVTGGTGYIGSHTVVELQQAGYEVIIVDNLSNSKIEVIDNIAKITGKKPEFEQFDLCDNERTKRFFAQHREIVAVIHFAAYKAVGESVELPLKYYANNLMSMINVLTGMVENNIQNLVFSSSCTVYGQPEILPVTENAPILKAFAPYGNTKQMCEEIIEFTTAAHKQLKTIALRYFNPIGAHKSSFIGELPLGVPNNLVPFITQTAAKLRPQLNVFGSDYNTPDGTAIRDYINVTDLALAHVVAIERLIQNNNKSQYEFFNIGTGNGVSVMEVIKSFEKVSGQKLNYRITARRAGDIEKIWAETSLAERELGWTAKKTLDETMLSAWNWQKHLSSI